MEAQLASRSVCSCFFLRLVLVQACQWDILLDRMVQGTCASKHININVEPVDDAPTIFSLEHPWALPLEVMEDIPMRLCCFTILDPDLRSAGATPSFSGSPWLFQMRIMARFGNITMANPGSTVLSEQQRNLISLEGYATDLEALLDSIVYVPIQNMNSNHAVDHLCFFLTDSPGSKRIGAARSFSSCWDVLIHPVNDPPVLTQLFEGTSLEPTCDFLELVNETFANLTGNLTCASGVRFRLENHGDELASIPLPPVLIEDVDAEEAVSDQPALTVLVRAELGRIQQPTTCSGLQVQKVGTELHGFWWQLQGRAPALNACLASGLMYRPPYPLFHGNDVVWVNASDLGHHGLPASESSTAPLQMLLHVYQIDQPLSLDVTSQLLPEVLEDVTIDIRAFKLRLLSRPEDISFFLCHCVPGQWF